MQLTISRTDLARVMTSVAKVVEARSTIPILSSVMLTATPTGGLAVMGTDLDIVATAGTEADVTTPGSICVDAKLLGDIARKAGADSITLSLDGDKLTVKSGRSKFTLQTLPASDFPDLGAHNFTAEFDIDLAALFAPVAFAMSTEETRYYLNGVFFRGGADSVAVATDGHRLAKRAGSELPGFHGVIVPRKAVAIMPKGTVRVSVSESRIRVVGNDLTITSKLIDGTYPDYERVIPKQNGVHVTVDRDAMTKAADRVVTISSEKGRAVKLSIAPDSVALSARSDVGAAEDEIAAEYAGEPFEIGFNSRYLAEILSVAPAGDVKLELAEGGPALIKGGDESLTLVLMPMRV